MINSPFNLRNLVSSDAEQSINAALVGTATRIETEMAGGDFAFTQTNDKNNIFNYLLNDIKKASPAKQAVTGGLSGWVLGYLLRKIGRTTLLAVGGGFVMLQIAQQQGLAEIDWSGIRNRLLATRDNIQRQVSENSPKVQQLQEVCRKYTYLTVSFVGGFILGVAM